MTMKWVARPPVKKESGESAVKAIGELRQRILAVHADKQRDLAKIKGKETQLFLDAESYRGLEDDVVSDAKTMASIFSSPLDFEEYYIYRINTAPVAVMDISIKDDHVKVNNLLAHPLVSGAAGAMIEVAINEKDWGSGKPVVKLMALMSAEAAYKALGFVPVSGDMVLDLNSPHRKWYCVAGYWQYVPSSGATGFLAGHAPKPPARR